MDSKYENFSEKSTHNGSYVFLLVVNACMGSFFFGYTLGVFNPVQKYVQKFVYPGVDDLIFTLATSLVPLGAGIGAVISGSVASKLGRKKAMIVTDIIAVIGTAITLMQSPTFLLVGRLICGFCVGLNSALVPTYISEVSPVKVKGTMGTFNQLFICIGVLVAFILGFGIPSTEGSQYWRIMLGVPFVTLGFRTLALLAVFTFDTPKYLMSSENYDECRDILKKIYGENSDEQYSLLQREKEAESGQKKMTAGDLFTPKYKGRFLAAAGLAILQQLSGINAIIFYSSKIFDKVAHGDTSIPTIYNTIVGVIQVIAALAAGAIISKVGRKSILAAGTAIVSAVLAGFGVISYLSNGESGILPYFIFAFMLAFGFSLGPVVWLYIPEVLPDTGVGIAVLLNWTATFIIAQGFPYMDSFIGTGPSFLVFAACCALGVGFIGKYVKETQGKSDAEISLLFSKEVEDSNTA